MLRSCCGSGSSDFTCLKVVLAMGVSTDGFLWGFGVGFSTMSTITPPILPCWGVTLLFCSRNMLSSSVCIKSLGNFSSLSWDRCAVQTLRYVHRRNLELIKVSLQLAAIISSVGSDNESQTLFVERMAQSRQEPSYSYAMIYVWKGLPSSGANNSISGPWGLVLCGNRHIWVRFNGNKCCQCRVSICAPHSRG